MIERWAREIVGKFSVDVTLALYKNKWAASGGCVSTTYVVLILYPKTNIFRLTFTRVIEIEMSTHPPLAA